MKGSRYLRSGARNLAFSAATSRAASVSEISLRRQSNVLLAPAGGESLILRLRSYMIWTSGECLNLVGELHYLSRAFA